jgi:hypothetical protein
MKVFREERVRVPRDRSPGTVTAAVPSKYACPRRTMAAMRLSLIVEAFDAESLRLSEVVAGLEEGDFARPSPCPPWTAGELLQHVRMTMERLDVMLAATEPDGAVTRTASSPRGAARRRCPVPRVPPTSAAPGSAPGPWCARRRRSGWC